MQLSSAKLLVADLKDFPVILAHVNIVLKMLCVMRLWGYKLVYEIIIYANP